MGHHGTSAERAESIVEKGFCISRNSYDWLGHGVYFFENALARAAEWATDRHGAETMSVVEARISLRDCLDLTDIAGSERLRPFFQMFIDTYGETRVGELHQTDGHREFDCEVINFACDMLDDRGTLVRVVRNCFEEGTLLWRDPEGRLPSSSLLDRNHIQLAVRHRSAIDAPRIAELPRRETPK